MGEFSRIAEQFADILVERVHLDDNWEEDYPIESTKRPGQRGISINDLSEIFEKRLNRGRESINLYPSNKKGSCCDFVVFISLTSPEYKSGRGHLNCRQAMEKIVQHMQGLCVNRTRRALFITDNWDSVALNDWKANLAQIRNHALLEIYLLSEGKVAEM